MAGRVSAGLAKLTRAIVGFRVTVERLEGKLKPSQNRRPDDRLRVAEQRHASGGRDAIEVARWMDRARDPR